MFSPPEATAKLTFREAATLWHDSRRLSLKPRTWEMYGHYISVLERFFGNIVLDQVHVGHFVRYQKWRIDGAGPSAINHELNTLAQILDAAGLWEPIKRHYHPLPLPRWTPPRVMSEEEEDRLFKIAASNPRWAVAYWVASITNNTSASGCELRGLQLRHVDLAADPPVIYVPSDSVKNEYRARVIPLNDRGVIQMQRIIERAHSLGSMRPEHYVFPLRVKKGVYDPDRPASASFIKKSFREMRDAAGLPWLRPHDLRHQVITKMLESGAPEQTVMSIAGHVSRQMLEHYSHQRVAAKKHVLDLINPDARVASRPMPRRQLHGYDSVPMDTYTRRSQRLRINR
jgi:integrase